VHWSRARRAFSVAVPPLAALVLAVMTVRQLDFLDQQGWSPVQRTRTLWPSLMALGPQGYVVTVVFVLLGAAVLIFANRLLHSPEPAARWAGAFLSLASLGLLLVAVPTDLPPTSDPSWHAVVHDAAYPLIPLGAIAATIALAASRSAGVSRTASRLLLPFMVVAFAATGVDSVAQLFRYLAFFSLLLWFEIVAVDRSL
jgi:hypothetical membrane protein